MKTTQRKNIKLLPACWNALDQIAEKVGATYRGRPSWRTMVRKIAEGKLKVRDNGEGN